MEECLCAPEAVRCLGERFKEYRMRRNLTRKEVSVQAAVGMTTLYKFESGRMYDISFATLFRLLRALRLSDNWENLLPALPESPYMYHDDTGKKRQRVRHSPKEK